MNIQFYKKMNVWQKYLVLFFIALIWFLPLSFFMDYNATVLWDPVTHFVNQSNIAFFDSRSFVHMYWLSDFAGAMWLKLCFSKAYLYWWFHFGGCVLVSLNSILWIYIFFSAFKLPASHLIPVGIVSVFSLFFPFYLMIGYETLPIFLIGTAIALLLHLSPEKHHQFFFVVLLGGICAILPETRYNLLPFFIVPLLCFIVYYSNDKRKMLTLSFFYCCTFLAGRFILWELTKKIFGGENLLSNRSLMDLILIYCRYWFIRKMGSILAGGLLFGLILFLKRFYQKFCSKTILFFGNVFIIFFFSSYIFLLKRFFHVTTLVIYVVVPLFICSLLLLLYLILHGNFCKKILSNNNTKQKISLFIAICMGFAFFTFGSGVMSFTVIVWSIPFISLFTAVVSYFLVEKKYRKIRLLIFSLLFTFNILVAIEFVIGFDISKYHWYPIDLGCCKGMFTSDKKRLAEYHDSARKIGKYISPGDYVFEHIPCFSSKWLPLTLALGGRQPFTYWEKMPAETPQKIDHVLIWHKGSEMFQDDKNFYRFEDLHNFGEFVVRSDAFSLIIQNKNFSFYSKKQHKHCPERR